MERRAVFDGLAERPVSRFAAPFAHGFERDDLPVDTGSGRDAVFVEILAVIGMLDFADKRCSCTFVSLMYINGLQRFSMLYSRVAYRLFAWSCARLPVSPAPSPYLLA